MDLYCTGGVLGLVYIGAYARTTMTHGDKKEYCRKVSARVKVFGDTRLTFGRSFLTLFGHVLGVDIDITGGKYSFFFVFRALLGGLVHVGRELVVGVFRGGVFGDTSVLGLYFRDVIIGGLICLGASFYVFVKRRQDGTTFYKARDDLTRPFLFVFVGLGVVERGGLTTLQGGGVKVGAHFFSVFGLTSGSICVGYGAITSGTDNIFTTRTT